MKPGPTTAKKIRMRVFQLLRNRLRMGVPKCSERVAGLLRINGLLVYGQEMLSASYNSARNKLITSSDVMTPVNFLSSSTTGSVTRLYLSNNSATSCSPAPASHEISGSWVSVSKTSSESASTNLDNGTAPARVPWESTR